MEWNGFNNELSRTKGVLHPANMYVFGPLIDAAPSYPDTILTTLTYMLIGQNASTDINVADLIIIGEKLEREFIPSLPDGFYKLISSPIKTMCMLKGQTKGTKPKPVLLIDLETLFLRLLLIGRATT